MVTTRLRTAFSDRSLGSYSFDVVNVVLLLGVVFVTLYPMYYILIVSFSDGKEVLLGRVRFWPRGINLQSYQMVLRDDTVIRSLFNSILYTSVGTLINLVLSTLCAYPLSRRDFSGRKLLTLYVAITMFFQGGLIPLYLVVLQLGLLDTMWAIVLVPAINQFYMFIMRTYFQGQPTALHEAAIIDGANDIQILARIVVPLAKPIMATMLLFYAVQHWNSFFPALIYLSDRERFPIQLILRAMVIEGDVANMQVEFQDDERIVDTTVKYAIIMVSTVPILLLYPFLQRYFVKGMMIGSLKG